MEKKLKDICLGHITPINERCEKCITDDYNRKCPDYRPMQVYEVIEIADYKTKHL